MFDCELNVKHVGGTLHVPLISGDKSSKRSNIETTRVSSSTSSKSIRLADYR